jgi:DNA invertase Pin-like site-specific DNA recombinase
MTLFRRKLRAYGAVGTPPGLKEVVKMIVGYAWISPSGVDREIQTTAFDQAKVDRLFVDVQGNTKPRHPKLNSILSDLQRGDTFVVYSLEAFGLTVCHLMELVRDLTQRGITLRSLGDNLDTSTSMCKLMFQTLGEQLGNLDRNLIRSRTAAGLAAAKARGQTGGRSSKLDEEKRALAIALHNDPSTKIADNYRKLEISRATYYRHVDMKTTRKPGRKTKTTASA